MPRTKKIRKTRQFAIALGLFVLAQSIGVNALAQDDDQVRVSLSTREAWVGAPIVLQIEIRNANDYKLPELPKIAGVDVRSSGSPSSSTQIQIFNGRRTESRSITVQFELTPRHEGEFEIPALDLEVDGKKIVTDPIRFLATKSETGDLLFVEITGKQDRVYVGQPLDLTLKIWIKPFSDREAKVKLSEANMWQMISEQTNWGSFLDRLQEMAQNRQRPAGREVLRDNGEGIERVYYLYEIEATVYPKQAGRISVDEVQIVVNYPQSLGRARDPFDDFFGDSPFGGSLFGDRLSITSSRPVVAAVNIDTIEVVPVPTEGRPADYRGAVGNYQIVSQASPTTVDAGDSIELKIGVLGNGPMELVQAPPLASLPELTGDFKVPDQPLAGFVQDDTKVFSTSIRPRREGITQIPGIPFSFFDPVKEEFRTVYSRPIKIQVNAAESLAMDSIVSARRDNHSSLAESSANPFASMKPDFSNYQGQELLQSFGTDSSSNWWWLAVVVPPTLLVLVLLGKLFLAIVAGANRFQSARSRGNQWIDSASSPQELAHALVRYLVRRMRIENPGAQSALGALRVAGLYDLAARIDEFLDQCRPKISTAVDESLEAKRTSAGELLQESERELARNQRSRVRRSVNRERMKSPESRRVSATTTSAILLAVTLGAMTFGVVGNRVAFAQEFSESKDSLDPVVSLDREQQTVLLEEATSLYGRAMELAETDTVESHDLFAAAAVKYQLLVDSGIANARLYANLANAFLQNDQPGRAIANYRRSLKLDPSNRQVQVNLDFARDLVRKSAGDSKESANSNADTTGLSWTEIYSVVVPWSRSVIGWSGQLPILVVLTISSLVFWGLWTMRAVGYRLSVVRWALLPGMLLFLSAGLMWLSNGNRTDSQSAVVVVDTVALKRGDGDGFEDVAKIEAAMGLEVDVLSSRSGWTKIRTAADQTGWIETANLEVL